MILFYTGVFFGVSVISYHSLPYLLRRVVASHYMVGFLYNFFISYIIQIFLAKSTATGVAQWFASIVFAIYIMWYKKKLNKNEDKKKLNKYVQLTLFPDLKEKAKERRNKNG